MADPENIRAKWFGNVSDYIRQTMPDRDAEALIAGFLDGDARAKRLFNRKSSEMKARQANGAGAHA